VEPATPEFAQRLMELLGKDEDARNEFPRCTGGLALPAAAGLSALAAGLRRRPASIPAITLSTNARASRYTVSLILLIMTALSFIPAFVMLMTSFTRIIIVFSILRQALGLQQTPSNQILTGMALFLTCSSWRRCSTR
jgi:flagellar biosynthetic protein FliP